MSKLRNADVLRRAELAQIHIAKVQLCLEEDDYRSLLLQVTGKKSSKDLTWEGRKALLDHFKKLGFKVKSNKAGRPAPVVTPDKSNLMAKVQAQLAEAKLPWTYADGMARRICKVDRIEWCDAEHLVKIIAALNIDAKRHGRFTG